MNREKCVNCLEYKRCRENWYSWLFLIIGLVATISMRLVTVLAHINPLYGQITWYIAVCGFFIFFLYKFKVDRARSRIIKEQQLMEKLNSGGVIENSDRAILGSMLCAISSNKDQINYSVIFVSSVIALITALYFDFIR